MSRGSTMVASHDAAGIAAWNFQLKGEIHSYGEAEAFIREGEDFDNGEIRRELGPKMYVIYRDGCADEGCPIDVECYEVYLYDTPIIRFYPDGTFSVDNGGFATPTTMYRLNAVLPDGFRAFHFSTSYVKRKIGLCGPMAAGFPKRRKVQDPHVLWPLDHTVRIEAATGRKVAV